MNNLHIMVILPCIICYCVKCLRMCLPVFFACTFLQQLLKLTGLVHTIFTVLISISITCIPMFVMDLQFLGSFLYDIHSVKSLDSSSCFCSSFSCLSYLKLIYFHSSFFYFIFISF